MDLTNEQWLSDLSRDGPEQRAALTGLRLALMRNLRRALPPPAAANEALIEDAVQDTLARVLERLSQFEGRSRFVTWATSIAIRVAMSELRRARWRDVSIDEVASRMSIAELPSCEAGLPARLERLAIVEKMYEIIEHQLTHRQRAVLLGELRGVPQDEIVRHLGSNRNAVYKLGHDARHRLKSALEEAGYHAHDIQSAFVE